jgi:serine/threonine-protein kinase
VTYSVLASAATSIVVCFVLIALQQRGHLAFLGGRGEAVEVPSLLGMQADQARELLNGRGLLFTLSAERETSSYPNGAVAEQSPMAGSRVQRGSTVQAALARGSKQAQVPALVGLRAEEALRQVVAAGFVAGPQKEVTSETAAAGTVIDTQPAPGTALKIQSTVTLIVSSGPALKPLPKLLGMRFRAARELLEQQGFKPGKIRYTFDRDRDGGLVLDQKPAGGTPASSGTAVDLTINED